VRPRWAGHVAYIAVEDEKNAYKVLMGKPEGKRPLFCIQPHRAMIESVK
jgi:hypothetical protein